MGADESREATAGDEFVQTVEALHDELLLRLSAAFAAQEGWANQLRAVAYELRDFLREDEERARLMVVEVAHAGPDAVAIRERTMDAVVELIDLGRQEREDPDELPRSVAEITAGAVYNRIHLGVEGGVETLDDEMVRELMFAAVLPYLGMEAALAELDKPPPIRPGVN